RGVYEVVRTVAERCLLDDGSLFTPGARVWTVENFESLRRHFVDRPDEGSERYIDKLRGQLSGASDDAIQLMAELHFVHLLLPINVTGATKRGGVGEVIVFMQNPVTLAENLGAALDHGFNDPGTFFSTRRDSQLCFLIEFGEAWKR